MRDDLTSTIAAKYLKHTYASGAHHSTYTQQALWQYMQMYLLRVARMRTPDDRGEASF